jgi:hypothetical protein
VIEWVLGPHGWHWEFPAYRGRFTHPAASAIEAALAGETDTGSTVGESAAPNGETPNA